MMMTGQLTTDSAMNAKILDGTMTVPIPHLRPPVLYRLLLIYR
jgi:hypothetical protein